MDYLNEILQAVIVILVPYLGAVVERLLRRVFDYMEANTTNKYLLAIENEAEKAVLEAYQGILKSAKAKCKDGKMDKKELEQLKGEAKQMASDSLKSFLKTLPSQFRDAFDSKVSGWIEAAIPKVKAKAGGIQINPSENTSN